jgi:hypothetical protein
MREREGLVDSVLVRLNAGAVLAGVVVVGDESVVTSPRNGGTFSLLPSPSRPVADMRGRFGFGVGSGVGGPHVELATVGDEVSD